MCRGCAGESANYGILATKLYLFVKSCPGRNCLRYWRRTVPHTMYDLLGPRPPPDLYFLDPSPCIPQGNNAVDGCTLSHQSPKWLSHTSMIPENLSRLDKLTDLQLVSRVKETLWNAIYYYIVQKDTRYFCSSILRAAFNWIIHFRKMVLFLTVEYCEEPR